MYRSLYSSRNPTISFNLIHILDCIYERRKRNVNKFIFPRYTVSFLSIFPLFFFIDRFFDSFLHTNFFCEIRWKNFTSYSLLCFYFLSLLRFVSFCFVYLFWFFPRWLCEVKFLQFHPINFNPSVRTRKAHRSRYFDETVASCLERHLAVAFIEDECRADDIISLIISLIPLISRFIGAYIFPRDVSFAFLRALESVARINAPHFRSIRRFFARVFQKRPWCNVRRATRVRSAKLCTSTRRRLNIVRANNKNKLFSRPILPSFRSPVLLNLQWNEEIRNGELTSGYRFEITINFTGKKERC